MLDVGCPQNSVYLSSLFYPELTKNPRYCGSSNERKYVKNGSYPVFQGHRTGQDSSALNSVFRGMAKSNFRGHPIVRGRWQWWSKKFRRMMRGGMEWRIVGSTSVVHVNTSTVLKGRW
jgi:hypothetical protein